MKPNLAHLKRLIGNPEVLALQADNGGYRPVELDGDLDAALSRHLRGLSTYGTYVVKGDEARTLVFDIDEPELEYAHRIRDALQSLGVPGRSIGIEFSGKKGHHVWVVLWGFVPARELRHLGALVLLESEVACEVFPKQDSVPEGGLGNLVKLPGGVHRVTGKPNNYIGPVPQPMSVEVFERLMKRLPPPPEPKRNGGPRVALECMAHIQAGVSQGNRNIAMFQFLAHARRSSIDEDLLWDAAVRLNERSFDPPLSDQALESVFESSRDRGPICRQLSEEIRCEDCPVLRSRGLYSKPGQVQNGAEGELVVVELGKKQRGYVDFIHPDVTTAKAALR